MTTLNTKDQTDLLFGDAKPIAEYLNVSVQTVKNWQSGKPMPTAAFKLMQLRHGDLSGLMGSEWEGFTFGRDGLLHLPGWRGGFEPHQIRAMFFQVQLVKSLEAQIRAIQRREASLEGDLSNALRQAAHYRRLTRLQSSMGMMLERITEN